MVFSYLYSLDFLRASRNCKEKGLYNLNFIYVMYRKRVTGKKRENLGLIPPSFKACLTRLFIVSVYVSNVSQRTRASSS